MTKKQRKDFARLYASSILWYGAESWDPIEGITEEDVIEITKIMKSYSHKLIKEGETKSGQVSILRHVLNVPASGKADK